MKKNVFIIVFILLAIIIAAVIMVNKYQQQPSVRLENAVGGEYDIIHTRYLEDYKLTIYVLNTADGLQIEGLHDDEKETACSFLAVSDGKLARAAGGRPFAVNGKPKIESLDVITRKLEPGEEYKDISFNYKALTDIDLITRDGVLIIIGRSTANKYQSEDIVEIALAEAAG